MEVIGKNIKKLKNWEVYNNLRRIKIENFNNNLK
jgi:hypothetical protein